MAAPGVKVEAILDKSNRTDKYSAADFLARAGIPTLINAAHAIAHNKIVLMMTAPLMRCALRTRGTSPFTNCAI